MKNVLVLISDPARPAVTDAAVASALEALKGAGVAVGTPEWLAPGIACDLPFEGTAVAPRLPDVDAVVLAAEGRRKKLLVADMESTMIHNEMLDELADFLGLREKIAGITARAMNGEIDFAGALEERVGLLKGLPVGRLDEAATRIRYMPGGATLVATMKKHGAFCALVSGGFTYFTAMVRKTLGFDLDAANVLEHDGSSLAGTVGRPILGKEAKLATLQRLAGGDRVVGRHVVERLPSRIEPDAEEPLLAHDRLARGRPRHHDHDLAGRVEHAEHQDALALEGRGDRHAGQRKIDDQVGGRGFGRHRRRSHPADGGRRAGGRGRLDPGALGQGAGRAHEERKGDAKRGQRAGPSHRSTSRLPSE